jgi:hypothetical protein
MKNLRSCFLAALLPILVGSCGSASSGTSSLPVHHVDICPDNSNQCQGTCCGTSCIDTTSDPSNCGGCDIVCTTGQACTDSQCVASSCGSSCGSGQSCCGDDGCKSLDSDVNNCGACGVVCDSDQTCDSGSCTGGSSTPDMGGTTDDCNDCNPACDTADGDMCLGNNCCLNDSILGNGSCTPDFNCLGF